ncbi:glycosyltransferase [Campylobacter coli]|nr:glycosyltransferase [Campylobacter coli]EHZ4970775.1 glycosyltransferase [Campylobacter coli]
MLRCGLRLENLKKREYFNQVFDKINLFKTIGVVIPIYNVEKYLRECLDSVINQTYVNLEIILVNDGSTDKNSLNIAKEYTLKDKRITLFDKKNGGLSSARNVGIEYFSGEYKLKNKTQAIKENSLIEFNIEGNNPYEIYTVYKSHKAFNSEKDLINFTYPNIDYIIFLDSDDYWELNCIEECVPRMDGVEVVWFDSQKIYSDMEKPEQEPMTILQRYNFNQSQKITQKKWLEKTLENNIQSFWFGWHGMINFNFLKNIKLKFFDYIVHEDNHFGPLLFVCSKNIYVMLNKVYIHRIRPNSIMDYRRLDTVSIPKFIQELFSFLYIENTYETKMLHRYISLFLIAFDLSNFIENIEISNKSLFCKIFSMRLRQWQMSLLETSYKKEKIFEIIFKIYKKQINIVSYYEKCVELYQELILQKNARIENLTESIMKNKELVRDAQSQDRIIHNLEKDIAIYKTAIDDKNKEIDSKNIQIQNINTTLNKAIQEKDIIINSNTNQINQLQNNIKAKTKQLHILQSNIQKNSVQLNQLQSKLSFQTKYGTAKIRIQNQLSYKLGQAMIVNSKSFLGYLIMPMALLSIMISHKQEQKIYQEKIKKNPSLKLPPLESYPDYKEALKFKNHLSYKLGEALIKASNNWYGGGISNCGLRLGN